MTDVLIRLSWPHKSLSPNARKDRREATPHRKAARAEGWAEAKRIRADVPKDAHLEITFYPPDERKRDLDNLLASIKPHLDGIAEATCKDDGGWSFTLRKGPKVKGGAVVVHVRNDLNWRSIGELVRVPIMGEIT
jgi:crossover junction endodeoxyribonuclease RusA